LFSLTLKSATDLIHSDNEEQPPEPDNRPLVLPDKAQPTNSRLAEQDLIHFLQVPDSGTGTYTERLIPDYNTFADLLLELFEDKEPRRSK